MPNPLPNPFSEKALVEEPALLLLAGLGWRTASAAGESFGEAGGFGRRARTDVFLHTPLREALRRLNPGLPAAALESAAEELTRPRAAMDPAAANRELYDLLKDGIVVETEDPATGGRREERVRAVDWRRPERNDFLLVSQMTFQGTLYTRRTDLVGFVNGLPWLVFEWKKPGVPVREAFEDNLSDYKATIPALFWANAFVVLSNGSDARMGTLTADWDRFFHWKRAEREDEPRRVSMDTLLRGTCSPQNLLDLVENFTLFSQERDGLKKIVAQNHQFLGVNRAIGSLLAAREDGHGRGGVFWQTQGSGKSFSMVFFAQKVLRTVPGDWTFVVVTDRLELDKQIAETFKSCGAVGEAESAESHAESGAHLRVLLRGNRRYVFTLIQKFNAPELLTRRRDVVVLTDEAHRSQYDQLATNMRAALPNALYMAFTGTPLLAGEELTRRIFGEYVSVYDFQQSVEDGATVTLFYENRAPLLELVNPEAGEEIAQLVEDAEFSPEQEARLAGELGRAYQALTRDDRLEKIARDITAHFTGRGFAGKAMVVSLDKATALRMYDKVRRHWAEETERVRTALGASENEELAARLRLLETTDMAVVLSSAQNEERDMRALGLEIAPHRRRMQAEKLDDRFKKADDPLRLVFVCAMWLTGFDVKSCSTIYLDKPMRNHSLMQTIARANRVFPDKNNGLIVDYANVFTSLERALALYGVGGGGERPVEDKARLLAELRGALGAAGRFCAARGVELGGLGSVQAVDDAVEALILPGTQREFLALEGRVGELVAAVKPDPAIAEFADEAGALRAVAESMRAALRPPPVEIGGILPRLRSLLDRSIVSAEAAMQGGPTLNLSTIDFAALRARFARARHRNTELERLRTAVRSQTEAMARQNRGRTEFGERLDALLAGYNAGSRSVADTFEDLLRLTADLSEEQQRAAAEGLTEEELVVFDILTRPAPPLRPEEREEVKRIAKHMLGKLKALLVPEWREHQGGRARVRSTIEEVLDGGLPDGYSPDLFEQKARGSFLHFYENYPDWNHATYRQADAGTSA